MNNASSYIEHISDTAFLLAAQRAIETKRHDAYFRDPFAEILAGKRGMEILQSVEQNDFRVGIVVRTCLIDQLIEQLIIRENIDTIINLGAGFDTRPYRLSLPNWLRWIEVDLPEILLYKEHQLVGKKPRCSLELVKLDITDISARNALFAQIGIRANRALVLTEGVIGYLIPCEVEALSIDLNSQTYIHSWLLEIMSPFGLAIAQTTYDRYFSHSNVAMKFAPEEGIDFFLRCGWKQSDSYSYWDESKSFGFNNAQVKLHDSNLDEAKLLQLLHNAVQLVLLHKH
jgi:methyltransferase (TIGR00027 family)